MRTLISGGTVVTAADVVEADVVIRGSKIEAADSLPNQKAN